MKRYFNLLTAGDVADIDIYGDITSWPWYDGDISAANLSQQLEELGPVSQINVHINSYGGEVAEGLAIYNALRRHNAHIVTTCDGMACSIASVIMMAGDERIMSESSLLMIHNAWSLACGNSAELRKQADDLDTITEASKKAYLSRVNIDEKKLSKMMDSETFITAEDACLMGFATAVETYELHHASQSARKTVADKLTRQNLDVSMRELYVALDKAMQAVKQADEVDEEEDEEIEIETEVEIETETEKDDSDDEDGDDEEKPAQSFRLAFAKFLDKE